MSLMVRLLSIRPGVPKAKDINRRGSEFITHLIIPNDHGRTSRGGNSSSGTPGCGTVKSRSAPLTSCCTTCADARGFTDARKGSACNENIEV